MPHPNATRQALRAHQQRLAAAAAQGRALGPKGRPPWHCGQCHGSARSVRTGGQRLCDHCHPPKKRGRPTLANRDS